MAKTPKKPRKVSEVTYKRIVSRSYELPIKIAEYMYGKIGSYRSMELDATTPLETVQYVADSLFKECRDEVERELNMIMSGPAPTTDDGDDGFTDADHFDETLREKPKPWNQYKVDPKYQPTPKVLLKDQDEDIDVVRVNEELTSLRPQTPNPNEEDDL